MARQNVKASLVIYANLSGIGWRRGSLIQAKNGRIKQGYLAHKGKEYPAQMPSTRSGPTREIRPCTRHRWRPRKSAGGPGALIDQRQLEQLEVRLGITIPGPKERPKTLATLREGFIDKYGHGSADTEYAYRYISGEFLRLLEARGKRYASEITEDDVIAFDRHLEALGNMKNTRALGTATCAASCAIAVSTRQK